jgi:hypothetical protein
VETTVAITEATRERIAGLQRAMRPEKGGRAVTVDEAINRALDRSDELARRIETEYRGVDHDR